jgi:deoxyribonuclease V
MVKRSRRPAAKPARTGARWAPPEPGRFAVVDVHYPAPGGALAAAVIAADLAFARIVEEHSAWVDEAAPYRSGHLWERELPALRAVLAQAGAIDLLVVDGYVQLDPGGTPGLGARAQAEFGVPVIGVAKTVFLGAGHAIPVLRGGSTQPLHVTAAGVPPDVAAELIRRMAGRFRLPDAVRRVDALTRSGLASRSSPPSGAGISGSSTARTRPSGTARSRTRSPAPRGTCG